MEAIYIPQLLQAREKTEEIRFEEFVADLQTLTPVRGTMVIRHHGTYLEISLVAETIMTLTCDRCLSNYNHRLTIDTSEIIWLEEKPLLSNSYQVEKEVKLDDLSETLSPQGYFSPGEWLYEQLCLAMPMGQLCSNNCSPPTQKNSTETSIIDARWSSLEDLKNQLS